MGKGPTASPASKKGGISQLTPRGHSYGALLNKLAAIIGGRTGAGWLMGLLLLLWYGRGADCACPSGKPVVQLGNARHAAYVRDGRNAAGHIIPHDLPERPLA
jgi:hypothetical protein